MRRPPPTVNLCRIASGYDGQTNLLISRLGNWMFFKSVQSSLVASPLLSDCTSATPPPFMKITLQRKISGYIKHNSVAFDSSLEARRSLQRTRLSQSLIHEQVRHLQISCTERKLSAELLIYRKLLFFLPLNLSGEERFCNLRVLRDRLFVDHLSTRGTSCSTILFGLPKKAFFGAMMSLVVHL